MSMIEPEVVGRGQPTTKGNPVVIPVTPGFPEQTNPPELNTGYASNQPNLPIQGGFTTTELDTRPLTHDQQVAQTTSDRLEAAKDASVQTGKVATVALLIASGVGAGLYLLYTTALAAVGALVPAEALKNNPMATSRSTSG